MTPRPDGADGDVLSEATVIQYIANPQGHHRRVSFQDEYRQLLEKYAIPYDERYVWD